MSKLNIDEIENKVHKGATDGSGFQKYLSEFVYGGIDGSVTTFAVVAGAEGANLNSEVVIILGFANLIADGFAMSVGSYLSAKTQKENYNKHRAIEYWEIENMREKEIEEVRDIFKQKGFEGDLLEKAVAKIIEDKDRWVDLMMKDELEMIKEPKSSFAIGATTFVSFIVLGFIPLITYVLDYAIKLDFNRFTISIFLTIAAFALIGFLKGNVNQTNKFKSTLETILLGGSAAILAYYVGVFLDGLMS